MGKKKFAKEPLLYIHQPSIQTPEAKMQSDYHTPKQGVQPIEKKPTEVKVANTTRRTRTLKRDHYEERDDKVVEGKVIATEEEKVEVIQGNTPSLKNIEFKNMTIPEKVSYFVNMPENIPKVRCEVKTYERTLQCVIADLIEGIVFVRAVRRKSLIEIPIADIKSIQIIGF